MSLHRYSVLAILKEMMLEAGMTSIISGSSVWKRMEVLRLQFMGI